MSSAQQFRQHRAQSGVIAPLAPARSSQSRSVVRSEAASSTGAAAKPGASTTAATTPAARSKVHAATAATSAARSSAAAASAYLHRAPGVSVSSAQRPVAQLTRPASYVSPSQASRVTPGAVMSPSRAAVAASSFSTAARPVIRSPLRPAAGPAASATPVAAVTTRNRPSNALARPAGSGVASSADEDSSPDFPYPATYMESKARLAAEERSRAAREKERHARAVREARIRREDSTASLNGDMRASIATTSGSSSSSSTPPVTSGGSSNAASSAPAATAAATVSPLTRRRLSTGPSAQPAANAYSSGIALMERKYEQQQGGPGAGSGTNAASTSASSSSSYSWIPPQPRSSSSNTAASSTHHPNPLRSSLGHAPSTSISSNASSGSASSSSSSNYTPSSLRSSSSSSSNFSFLSPSLGTAPSSSSSSALWSCGSCTYDNPARSLRCEMCNTPKSGGGPLAHLTSPASFGEWASFSIGPGGPSRNDLDHQASVRAESNRVRNEVRAALASRASSHEARAQDAMTRAAETRRRAREQVLEGLTTAGAGAPAQGVATRAPQPYSYAARGAELAAQARSRGTDSSDDDEEADESDEEDHTATSSLAPSGLPRRAHDRETVGQAMRRAEAARSSQPASAPEPDPDLPALHPRTREHMATLNEVHARVNDLQRQIDSELGSIERARVLRERRAQLFGEEERKYPESSSFSVESEVPSLEGSDNDDDNRSDDSSTWPSPSPALALTQQRPNAAAVPPPRRPTNARVTTNFSPFVSPAERARREAEESGSAAAAASSNNNGGVGIQVGSLSVRLDRANALRQEMLFLSSLFDNVRSYQTSLVHSLHQAGFVDDQSMARLPGLHVGLIHYLIESAWAAAARSAGLEGAAAFEGQRGPQLPDGHADRVKELPVVMLQTVASDSCCICLDEMGVNSAVSSLMECKHMFHSSCIKEWLSKANSCPLCKRTAIADPNPQANKAGAGPSSPSSPSSVIEAQ